MKSWIGIDLDGTLAVYDEWKGPTHIGPPVIAMLEMVRNLVKYGGEKYVKIFTARVCSSQPEGHAEAARTAIQDWLEAHGLPRLAVTAEKDYEMVELWDDIAVRVGHNTGHVLTVSM